MTNEYASLVKAMKALTQVVDPEAEVQKTVTLPVAEDEWRTRPDTGSCWELNSHQYERDTGLFHWEWTFEV